MYLKTCVAVRASRPQYMLPNLPSGLDFATLIHMHNINLKVNINGCFLIWVQDLSAFECQQLF